jgi:hypothetical protein
MEPDARNTLPSPASTASSDVQPPVGHYGPGYGDPTPVDPAQTDPMAQADAAYDAWRSQRLRELDEDYAAWRQSGATSFPADFESWRQARRELIVEQSSAGLPLVQADADAPESEKAALLFERS